MTSYDAAPPSLTAAERFAFHWALGGIEAHAPDASADLVGEVIEALEVQAQTLVPAWQATAEDRAFALAARRAAQKVRSLHNRRATHA